MAGARIGALGCAILAAVLDRCLDPGFSPLADIFPAEVIELAATGFVPSGLACDRICRRTAAEIVPVVKAAPGCAKWVARMAFVADPEPRHGIAVWELADHLDIIGH